MYVSIRRPQVQLRVASASAPSPGFQDQAVPQPQTWDTFEPACSDQAVSTQEKIEPGAGRSRRTTQPIGDATTTPDLDVYAGYLMVGRQVPPRQPSRHRRPSALELTLVSRSKSFDPFIPDAETVAQGANERQQHPPTCLESGRWSTRRWTRHQPAASLPRARSRVLSCASWRRSRSPTSLVATSRCRATPSMRADAHLERRPARGSGFPTPASRSWPPASVRQVLRAAPSKRSSRERERARGIITFQNVSRPRKLIGVEVEARKNGSVSSPSHSKTCRWSTNFTLCRVQESTWTRAGRVGE